jgi:RNA polymerase sporulation-specific sigma factor
LKKDCYSLYKIENIKRAKIDSDYMGEVIEDNKDLIWHSFHKYIGNTLSMINDCGMSKEDIEQIGKIGFIKAIRAFDPNRGYKFSSFGVVAIVREIRHVMRSNYGIIKIPRSGQVLLKTLKDIEADLGYTPSIEELSILMNISEKRVKEIQKADIHFDSMNEPPVGDFSVADKLDSGERVDKIIEEKILLDKMMAAVREKASELEIKILKDQVNDKSQIMTAMKLNISQMRVSRVVASIREILNNDYDDWNSSKEECVKEPIPEQSDELPTDRVIRWRERKN